MSTPSLADQMVEVGRAHSSEVVAVGRYIYEKGPSRRHTLGCLTGVNPESNMRLIVFALNNWEALIEAVRLAEQV